jgi:hypothetical protein
LISLGWDENRKKTEIDAAMKFLKIMGLDFPSTNAKQYNAIQLVKFRQAFQKIDQNEDGIFALLLHFVLSIH